MQEHATAEKIQGLMDERGYETFVCGGTGVVATLRNGDGPVVAYRADTDGLPIQEDTGADFASTARGRLPDGTDVPAAIAALTGGGSHVSVDAVGSEQTATDAVLGLRRRGRHVQIGLLPPADGHPRVPLSRVIAWELDVLGSHGMAAADYALLLADVASGRLREVD